MLKCAGQYFHYGGLVKVHHTGFLCQSLGFESLVRNQKDGDNMKIAVTDEEIKDEVMYFNTLYDFTNVISRLNNKAFDGVAKDSMEKNFCKLIPAFTLLCGVNMDDNIDISEVGKHKKPGPKGVRKKDEPKQEEPEKIPDNFMKEDEGWGLCPVCRKKMVKLTSTTRLIDFPAYCKSCKMEYVVSWWNAESKDIAYTRYVNDSHHIAKRNIRHEGMKGTGLKSFTNTRTSATERVAMHL